MTSHHAITDIKRINEILSAVGRLDGIDDLRLSPEGAAKLLLAGGKEVFFEYCEDSRRLFIYTPVLPLPLDVERRCALLQRLLDANFLKLRSGEGEYAIAESEKAVVYQLSLPMPDLNVPLLDKSIDTLLRRHDEASVVFRTREGNPPSASSGFRNALLRKAMAVANGGGTQS